MSPSIKLTAAAATLLASLLLLTDCGEQAADQAEGGLDLIALHGVARQLIETGGIDISSPLGHYYTERGWSRRFCDEQSGLTIIAAVTSSSILRYQVLRPAERWLEFNVSLQGPFKGPRRQRIRVFAGRRKLASFALRRGEDHTLLVRIPAEVQRAGENEIRFRFAKVRPNRLYLCDEESHRREPHPGIAAYFGEFKIFFGDAEGPWRDRIRDDIDVFSLSGDGRSLAQTPNSALTYAFEIARGTRLLLRGIQQASVGDEETGELTVSVSARTDTRPQWNQLWSRSISIGPFYSAGGFEADLQLDDYAGEIAELRFEVSASGAFSNARVLWERMRLLTPETEVQAQQSEPVRIGDGIRHVVVIVLDAARPDHFGCYGDERGMTPNIDALSENSIVFRNAVAPAPYTIASVSSIFSGLLPETHGVRDNTRVFPEELENMARAFNRGGYYTLALAGTHFVHRKYGITRDCDDVVLLYSSVIYEENISLMDEAAMEGAVAAAAASGQPIFLYAHFLPPHWPYDPPEPFDSHFDYDEQITYTRTWMLESLLQNRLIEPDHPDIATLHRRYMNNLVYGDYLVGQLLETLRRHGLYDDALVIVTADHGEEFGEHRFMDHNSDVYDTMIAVPFIVRVPGDGQQGEVRQQVGLIDLFPTFVELFGLDAGEVEFEGRSIAPLVAGREQETGDFYYSRASSQAIIFTLRGERYKFVHHHFRDELYDLNSDPEETHNIIDRHPVLATFLRQRGMLFISSRASEGVTQIEISPEERRALRDLGYF